MLLTGGGGRSAEVVEAVVVGGGEDRLATSGAVHRLPDLSLRAYHTVYQLSGSMTTAGMIEDGGEETVSPQH